MSNKVRFGLKNVYYATVTFSNNTPTFGTPKRLPGAVNLTMDPQGETVKFYADDGVYFTATPNNGYEGTLQIAKITDDFAKDCLGQTEDNDGLIVEKSSDKQAPFALLFEFTGDEKGIRHCIYNCTASRPTKEGATKEEGIEVATDELTFVATPLPGSEIVKAKTGDTVDTTRYNSWFTSVALPDFPELTVSPKEVTFDDEDVALTVTGGTVTTVKLGGETLESTAYTISGTTVTLKSTYLATLDEGTYRFVLSTASGDNASVIVTIEETIE